MVGTRYEYFKNIFISIGLDNKVQIRKDNFNIVLILKDNNDTYKLFNLINSINDWDKKDLIIKEVNNKIQFTCENIEKEIDKNNITIDIIEVK